MFSLSIEKLTLRKRAQLFEFDDQPWLPQSLRRIYMEILGNNVFRVAPFKARLSADLDGHDVGVIHSLCSGDGQFVFMLYKLLEKERRIRFILSDLFPISDEYARIKAATNGNIDFVAAPVDATRVQPARGDWLLMAGSLHHLREEQVKAIFERVVANDGVLIMMENHDRSYAQALKLVVILPTYSILAAIFGRPFRWDKLLFGALLPIVPVMILVDGFVSNLRSYRPADLQKLLASLPDARGYSVRATPVRYGVVLRGMYFVLAKQAH